VKHQFFTGFPQLDLRIGTLHSSDSILLIEAEKGDSYNLIKSLLSAAFEGGSPVIYLAVNGSLDRFLSDARKVTRIDTDPEKVMPQTLKNRIERSLKGSASRAVLITDDLSSSSGILKGPDASLVLFSLGAALAETHQWLFVTTALRSSFKPDVLAKLKDSATVCLDLHRSMGELFAVPITLKGRYLADSHYPIRLRPGDSRRSQASEGVPDQSNLPVPAFNPDESAAKVFHASTVPMVLFDTRGDYREFNIPAVSLLGYPLEELKSRSLATLAAPGGRLALLRFLASLRHAQKSSTELRLQTRSGKIIPVQAEATRISRGAGLVHLHDLTEQAEHEEEILQRSRDLESVLEHLPEPVCLSQNGQLLWLNDACIRLLGFSNREAAKELSFKTILTPESLRKYNKAVKGLEDDETGLPFEVTLVRADGTQAECTITARPAEYNGRKCRLHLLSDTTVQRRIVRQLTESEARYRTAIERSPEAVAFLVDGAIAAANDSFRKLLGVVADEEIIAKPLTKFADESDEGHLAEHLGKAATSRKGGALTKRCSLRRTDATVLRADVTVAQLREHGGTELLCFLRDQTDTDRLAVEASQHDLELSVLNDFLPGLQRSMDLQKLNHSALVKLTDTLEWDFGLLFLPDAGGDEFKPAAGRNVPAVIQEKLSSISTSEGIGGYLSKTQEPHIYPVAKYPSFLPHRPLFRDAGVTTIALVPFLSGEKVAGILIGGNTTPGKPLNASPKLLAAIGRQIGAMITTLTAYKSVKERQVRAEALVESSTEILYSAAPDGSFHTLNGNIEKLVGMPAREFYRNRSLWMKLVHEEDKRLLLARVSDIDALGTHSVLEYRVLPRGKAVHRWVRDIVTIVRDESGRVTELLGAISDITEQKDLLDSLRDDDSLKTNIFASMKDGMMAFDRNLRCTQWNPVLEAMSGIAAEDAVGKAIDDIPLDIEPGGLRGILARVLDGEISTRHDAVLHPRDGSQAIDLWERYSPLHSSDEGEIAGVVGLLSDVSARKKFERDVRDSERILSNVIDTMGDLLLITDLRGKVVQVNKAFLTTLGYTRAEAVGCDFPYPWLLEEEMSRVVEWIGSIRDHNSLYDFDMTWRTRDGRPIAMSLSTTLLRNSLGEPIAMLNMARDISERVRMLNTLEQRNRQIELINRIISTTNQTMDFNEVFSVVVREIRSIVPSDMVAIGLLNDQNRTVNLYGLTGSQVFWKNTPIPIERTVIEQAVKTLKAVIVSDFHSDSSAVSPLPIEKEIRSLLCIPIFIKGKTFGTLNIGSRDPYAYSDVHAEMFQPIAQQVGSIIDRVLLFNQVTSDAAYIHNLLDSIDSVVYTVDTQCRIREVNNAWYEFVRSFGVQVLDEYNGRDLFDVVPTESLRVVFQNVVDQLLGGTIRIFSQEFVHATPSGERTYQLTIMPMLIDQAIIGLVFTHTDITSLKRTEGELKKSNEQLLALNEISRLFSASSDLPEMLRSAIPLLQKTVGCDAVIVYLREEETDELILVHHAGFPVETFPSLMRLRLDESATGEVVSTKRPIYVPRNVHQDERILPQNRQVLRYANCEALAIVPLISKDRVIGAVDIFYRLAHDFTEREQQLLTLVGNQFGNAVENALLYGEWRSQVDRLTALYKLSEQLTSTLNIDQMFQVVCEHAQSLAPFRKFTIDFVDQELKTITPAFRVEAMEEGLVFQPVIHQASAVEPHTAASRVLQSLQSYLSSDRRQLIIPMLSKQTIIGLLSVDGGHSTFTETHQQILESIANLTAISLEKGKLYEETLQKSLEIERRNKELDDFTYVVSHDLKEPLISIEGFSRILQLDYGDIIQGDGKEYLDSIVGGTTRMKGLIDDLLLLSRVSRPSEEFKAVAIHDVLEHIRIDLEFTIRQRGVQLVLPRELPYVEGNETQITIVFRNLIGNAIKFNRSASPVVEVGFQNTGNNSYLFYVKDNGIGIDKDFFEKIFVIFQRLHRREEYEGTGAGLAIVKKIVELHRGKIWVESELGNGSTFFFTLPKPLAHES
jgi:PAS domain S-box-containing protein